MAVIKQVQPYSLARAAAFIFFALGIIQSLLYAASIVIFTNGDTIRGISIGIIMMLFILLPIAYLVIGSILGFLTALFYNFIANRYGGISIELE